LRQDVCGFEIQQQGWALMADVDDFHPACVKALEGLIEGLAAGCGRGMSVGLAMQQGAPQLLWSVR
jgi:hypothetical protein